jgi:hypothetical protein
MLILSHRRVQSFSIFDSMQLHLTCPIQVRRSAAFPAIQFLACRLHPAHPFPASFAVLLHLLELQHYAQAVVSQ